MIHVQIDARDTLAEFETIRRDQVPYAFAVSLTRTAQRAQKAVQQGLPLRFTIRRLPFMQSGVRVTAATKSNPVAIVQDIHGDPDNDRSFMELQETGGVKVAHGGKTYICVPTKWARPTLTSSIARANLPHEILARGGFIGGYQKFTRGTGRILFARTVKLGRSPGRKSGFYSVSGGRSQIIPMYILVPEAKIKPRYQFVPTVVEAAQTWSSDFEQEFHKAVRTSTK